MPHPPYSPSLTASDFFLFPQLKNKSPQKEMFADVKEVKQKTAEALEGIQIGKFKNCLSDGEDVSVGALQRTESALAVTGVYTCQNKYPVFYK